MTEKITKNPSLELRTAGKVLAGKIVSVKMKDTVVVQVERYTKHPKYGKFLKRLRETPDGDGSLLDHSLILFGSGMSESNTHSRLDIPTLLAGGAAGKMKGNRHVAAKPETPFANLLLEIAQKFGVETEKFGLSNGRMEI